MKKMKSGARRSPPKRRSGTKTVTSSKGKAAISVDEYLAGVPEPARSTLRQVRAAIRSAVPAQASETISYGIPAFKYQRVLVWYAAFSNHCSLFPTALVIDQFKSELRGFTISKGTIQFPTDKPLPAAIIRKMVKARIAHIESKKPR